MADRLSAKVFGAEQPRSDPAAEAAQLAERAREYQRLGNWEESLAVIEASLLLQPDQPDLHRRACDAYGTLCLRHGYKGRRNPEEVRLALLTYRQGIEHEESCSRPPPTPPNNFGKPGPAGSNRSGAFRAAWSQLPYFASLNPKVRDLYDEVAREGQESLLRLTRLRARAGCLDEAVYLSWALEPLELDARYPIVRDLLEEFQDLPHARERARIFAKQLQVQAPWGPVYTPQYLRFLEELAKSSQPEYRAAAGELKKRWEADRGPAEERKKSFMEEVKRIKNEASTPPTAVTGGPRGISFRPVRLTCDTLWGTSVPLDAIKAVVPVGDKVDVVAGYGALFVMREKGRLKQVWAAREPNAHPQYVCYDGRYVWVPVLRLLKTPLLLVFDPATDTVAQVTAADGLPIVPRESLPPYTLQGLAATPLGPGRVCVAGWFGRTWLAIVTFDPKAGKSVKVFHEARARAEAPDDWKRTTVAFEPTYLCTLADGAGPDGKPVRRVLVGRKGALYFEPHPLLVDPEKLSVEVVQQALPEKDSCFAANDGHLYCFTGPRTLSRVSFPGLRPKPVLSPIGPGPVVVLGDRVVTVGKPWWVGSLSLKAAHPARELPGDFGGAWPSAHYGVLVQSRQGRAPAFYQAVFPDVVDDD